MTSTERKAVLKVLWRARRHLDDPKKWHQGDFWYHDSCCAVGALGFGADARFPVVIHASGLAERILGEYVPTETALAQYNDDLQETAHDDILTVFDWAIGTLEAGVEL